MDGSIYADSARATALRIFSAQTGVPLMIPGALEVRVRKPSREQTEARVAVSPVLQSAPDARYDRGRTERQIEGGGALSQRRPARHRTWIAKLVHTFERYGQIVSRPGALSQGE